MARFLVTGSQGFVGTHLRAPLVSRGIEPIGVDKPGTGAEIERDLSDPSLDMAALVAQAGTIDAVVYMAATITRGSSVDRLARDNLRVIADAPVRLMEAFAAAGTSPHIVYCSTYKTYGPPVHLPIDPLMPPQSPDPRSYGSAKALAENWVTIAAKRLGQRLAIVRPTCIYGPGQHVNNAIPVFLRAALRGDAPVVAGEGTSLRDDVYAPDVAWVLTEAALRKAEGAFHAAGERARTIFEVAEACCRAVEAIGGPKVTPVRDRTKAPKWWIDQSFDLERTKRELGYEPTSLCVGLETQARWIREVEAAR